MAPTQVVPSPRKTPPWATHCALVRPAVHVPVGRQHPPVVGQLLPLQLTPTPSHVPPSCVQLAEVCVMQLPLLKQQPAVGCGQLAVAHVEPSPWYVPPSVPQSATAVSCANTCGIASSSDLSSDLRSALRELEIGAGVRMPATTSSPCALIRYSP